MQPRSSERRPAFPVAVFPTSLVPDFKQATPILSSVNTFLHGVSVGQKEKANYDFGDGEQAANCGKGFWDQQWQFSSGARLIDP